MTPTPETIRAEAATGTAEAEPSRLRLAATAPVEIQAARGEGRRPTFDIVGYTGAVINVEAFFSPVIVDLTGLTVAGAEIPALRDHDLGRIVGQTDSIKIGTDVRLTGVITGENADAAEVLTQAKNGFKWRASIGATIARREFLDVGKTATINGREVAGPLVIAREAVLDEISFVAIGADNNTSVDVAASRSRSQPQAQPPPPAPAPSPKGAYMDFNQWLQAKGFTDPAALDDAQRNSLRAIFDAEQAASAGTRPDPDGANRLDQIVAARKREDERINAITQVAAQYIDERPGMVDEINAMARAAIDDKQRTPTDFELHLSRAVRPRVAPAGASRLGVDSRAAAKVVEAALCLSGGLGTPEKAFDERTLNMAADRFPHGLGLCDVLLMAARDNGFSGHSPKDVRGLLQAAFPSHGAIRAQGWSTLSLPGIFTNTANKFLVGGFNAVENTWRQIAARRSVGDFKTITSYSLTGGLMYEKVGPGGELKHGTLGELSYTNRAETYGRMFAITRQDIVNDDLGALTQLPTKLGRGAALKLNDEFWKAFLDNSTFFTTGRANYDTGADTALGIPALSAAETLFMGQTDPDGYPVAITPRILLVPNALGVLASNLMASTMVAGDTTANTLTLTNNPFAGRFRVAQSSYLSNSSYTGYSTTGWYLLADPAELAVIEVAFLNGKETPTVESADADFNSLGVQFRGFFDFGISLQEYRAGVKEAGV